MDKLYHLFEIFKESFLDFWDDWINFFDVKEIASKNVSNGGSRDDK